MPKPRKKRKPTKTKEVVKKVSNSELQPLIDDVVKLVDDGKDTRMTTALVGYHMGMNAYQAGKMAGYSDSYCRTRLGTKIKEGKFRERMRAITKRLPGVFKEINDLTLLDLASAQVGAVKIYKDDPEKLLKYPQLARQIKAVSGLLNDEVKPTPTINIGQMNVLQGMIGDDLDQTIKEGEIVDAELKQIASVSRPGGKR